MGTGIPSFAASAVRFHLNELSKVLKPSFHAKYNAAEVVMIDFAGSQMHFIDTSTGEETGCPVLVCVLPFSNLTYVQSLPDAKLPNLIAALNNCLRYFNGAPLSLKTDNMKQVAQKSNRYDRTADAARIYRAYSAVGAA